MISPVMKEWRVFIKAPVDLTAIPEYKREAKSASQLPVLTAIQRHNLIFQSQYKKWTVQKRYELRYIPFVLLLF